MKSLNSNHSTSLEKVIMQQIHQLHMMEASIEASFNRLQSASQDQIAGFAESLAALQHRASRVERLVDAIG